MLMFRMTVPQTNLSFYRTGSILSGKSEIFCSISINLCGYVGIPLWTYDIALLVHSYLPDLLAEIERLAISSTLLVLNLEYFTRFPRGEE